MFLHRKRTSERLKRPLTEQYKNVFRSSSSSGKELVISLKYAKAIT